MTHSEPARTRYRRAEAVERAQFRWVMAGGGVSVAIIALQLGFGDRFDGLWFLFLFSLNLPIVAIGIAITRYRLYDIDRIISSTIAYTLVSAVLATVLAAGFIGLQLVLEPWTRDSTIAVAGSTLLAAALFRPVRSRVQAIVDRRFHRARYDAERTVEAFAGRLRDQLDLGALTGKLRRTAEAAIEPASTAVWLRAGRGNP